ncbi:MAG: dTDP-4-dehydrorhamnose reductase [Candidatus Gastranaerophilales bacterium]|nr:dTDP-4-dehydrorhamnose reductase [Candidatus Gastranaerophilales bacterium]
MKVLVTGAKGMLGQDLCPILEDEGFDVIETDIDNMDITQIESVEQVLSNYQPDFIVHCAAYTNVDKAEEDKETAFKINKTGTENIAKIAKNLNITLIYISTDYVFDGSKKEKYQTNDPVNPINVYGESKLAGEKAVQECDKYYITRTSWLYGHHGKNFVETMLSLRNKEELKVVDDQVGCPTWTVELANGIVKIIKENLPYGIYHVCGSGETSWYGFAKKIFELSNIQVNLIPCTSEEFPRPAKRPFNSIMENNKICRNWESALKNYLELRCE